MKIRTHRERRPLVSALGVAIVLALVIGAVLLPLQAKDPSGGTHEDPNEPDVPFTVPPSPEVLSDDCTASLLGQTVQVNSDGTFVFPTVPISQGLARVRFTCNRNGMTLGAASEFFNIAAGIPAEVGAVTLQTVPPVPVAILVASPSAMLQNPGEQVQLAVTATYSNMAMDDVTPASDGTVYAASNPAICTVSLDGLVTAGSSSGTCVITAVNEGVVGSTSIVVTLSGDSDGDMMPDDFEALRPCLDPNVQDGGGDPDGDGLASKAELDLGTEPCTADTDGDGLSDGQEIALGTAPADADSDDDFLLDGQEVNAWRTNPLNPDTDGGCLADGIEVRLFLNPRSAFDDDSDRDFDGLPNCDEVDIHLSDPGSRDTDADNCQDGAEVLGGTSPVVPSPMLFVDPGNLELAAVENGPSGVTRFVGVTNRCGGAMSWSFANAAPWLDFGATSGSVGAGQTELVAVSLNASGLTPGTLMGSFDIVAPGALDPNAQVLVNAHVLTGSCRGLFFSGQVVLADDCFLAAIAADPSASDPNTQEAHVFRAFTRIARVFEEQADGPDPSVITDSIKEMLDAAGFSAFGRTIFDWHSTPPPAVPANAPTSGELQAFLRDTLLPQVRGAIDENLAQIDSSFQMMVFVDERWALGLLDPNDLTDPNNPPAAVEVDFGDIELLRSGFLLLDGNLRIAVANSLDANIQALSLLDPLKFEQDILQPNPKLLTLGSTGTALMVQAGEDFREAVDAYYQASDFIRNLDDFDQSDDLVALDPNDLADELALREGLVRLRCLLDGHNPVGLDGSGAAAVCDTTSPSVVAGRVVNIAGFFDNPDDLRNLVPGFAYDPNCGRNYVDSSLISPSSPVPDPTLIGLVPSLTQADVVSEAMLSPDVFMAGTTTLSTFGNLGTTGHENLSLASLQAFVDSGTGRMSPSLRVDNVQLENGTRFSISSYDPNFNLVPVAVPVTLCRPHRDFLATDLAFAAPGFHGGFTDILSVTTNDPDEPVARVGVRGCTGTPFWNGQSYEWDCDNDGTGDLLDPCPDDPANGCSPSLTASFTPDLDLSDPAQQCPGALDSISLQPGSVTGRDISVAVVITDCDGSMAVNGIDLSVLYDFGQASFVGCTEGSLLPPANMDPNRGFCDSDLKFYSASVVRAGRSLTEPLTVSVGVQGRATILNLNFRLHSAGLPVKLRLMDDLGAKPKLLGIHPFPPRRELIWLSRGAFHGGVLELN